MKKFLVAAMPWLACCTCRLFHATVGAGRRPVDRRSGRCRRQGRDHDQRHHHRPASRARRPAPGANPLKDPNNVLSKRSVYFEFDSFVVEDKYKAHDRGARQVPVRQPEPPRSRCKGTPTSAARGNTTSRSARSAPRP